MSFAQVAIVVFDVTSSQSFAVMKGWVDELRSVGPTDIRLIIAANKCDRDMQREVSFQEAEQYAEEIHAHL